MTRRPRRPPEDEKPRQSAPPAARQPLAAEKLREPSMERSTDLSDPEAGPLEEPGVSIEAMEVGVQFLRDATEQYNFESGLGQRSEHGLSGVPVGQLISDATLESANQADFEVPMSAALSEDEADTLGEPEELEIDLRANAIVAGSLFDHPVSDIDDEVEESEAEDDFAATFAAPMRAPHVMTDDPSDVDADRLQEIQRQLDERVKKRLHVDVLPAKAEDERDGGAPAPPDRRAKDV
jgi:hypothetical protein